MFDQNLIVPLVTGQDKSYQRTHISPVILSLQGPIAHSEQCLHSHLLGMLRFCSPASQIGNSNKHRQVRQTNDCILSS